MSDEPASRPESGPAQASANSSKAEKKPRSPVERCLVWGGIIALLLLVAVQAHARFGYTTTLNRLQPLIDDDFEGGEPLELADADSHVLGIPPLFKSIESGSEREYRWYGLGRSYGITLSFNPDVQPVIVTRLETDAPPVDPPVEMAGADSAPSPGDGGGGPDPSMMHGAGGAPGGGGPGGGGGRPDPMQNDADGDGRLSREEAPERMRDNFDEIDANQDGFVEPSEIEAMREQVRLRTGDGEEGGDRPQRPASEGSDDAPDSPPAETAPADETGAPAAEETPAAAGETESGDAP